MRILHAVLSDEFYGSERYCVELAVSQAHAGHEIAVLIHGADTPCRRQFVAAAEEGGDNLSLIAMAGRLPALLHRPYARRAIKRFAPQIVHSHLGPATRRVGVTAQRLGIPHVTTLHLPYDAREHGVCDGLICVAGWQRASLPASFHGEAATVWNWLPASVERSLSRADTGEAVPLRAAWRASSRTVVFGSVGRLAAEKGMDRAVTAFLTAFPKGDEDAALAIVGGGARAESLKTAAGGDRRIHFLGPVADVAPYYRAFDVFVSAARSEPFGLAILEAMVAGLPLILTRTQGPQEFLASQDVAWAPTGDDAVAVLAAAMREAAASGRPRRSYDLSAFSVERAAGEIEDFYRSVIARKR